MKKNVAKIVTPLLEVKNFSKYFVSRNGITKAVDNVSFTLNKGEIIGLIGQSGSGKSTIGNGIMKLLSEMNGIVTLEGKIVSGKISKDIKKFFNKNVQMIFQDPHTSLNEKRNVFSTIAEPLRVSKIINEWTKDFFENYNQVLSTFELSFKKEYKRLEVEFMEIKKRERLMALQKTWFNLKNFSLKNLYPENIDNLFSQLIYIYFENRVQAENNIISYLLKSLDSMFNLYNDAKIKIKNRKLPKDEIDYIDAQENLKKYIDSFNDMKIGHKIYTLNKNFKKEIKNHFNESRILFSELINDRKRKLAFYKQLSILSTNKKDFYSYKNKILNFKKEIKIFKNFVLQNYWIDINSIYELENKVTFSKSDKILIIIEEYLQIFNDTTKKNIDDFTKKHNQNVKLISEKKGKKIQPDKKKLDDLKDKVKWRESIFENVKKQFLISWKKEYEQLLQREKIVFQIDNNEKKLRSEIKQLFKKHISAIFKDMSLLEIWNKKKIFTESKTQLNARKKELNMVIDSIKLFEFIFGFKKVKSNFKKNIVKNMLLKKTVFDSLKNVGLKPEHAYRYPHEFSGGQKQRINIARALVMKPKLIIADEPIASLDVSIQAQIINILIDLVKNQGISMIFIGHDLSVMEYLTDKLLVMHSGKIVESGQTDKIYQNPIHPYTQTLFSAIPKILNANVPFKSYNTEWDYLEDYSKNEPKVQEVSLNHYVLANDSQFTKWVFKKKK